MDATEYLAEMFRAHRFRYYAAKGGPSGLHRWFVMHPRGTGWCMFALVMVLNLGYGLWWPGGDGGLLVELAIGLVSAAIGGLLFTGIMKAERRIYTEWLRQSPTPPRQHSPAHDRTR